MKRFSDYTDYELIAIICTDIVLFGSSDGWIDRGDSNQVKLMKRFGIGSNKFKSSSYVLTKDF